MFLRRYKTDFSEEKNDFYDVLLQSKTDFGKEKITSAMFYGNIKLILDSITEEKNYFGYV